MNFDIYAFIFARGGSKGLKNKNILNLGNKPLIAHSIDKSSAATDQSDYKLDTETLLSRLRNVEDALKAYDAKAVEYINSLAANYSESVYAHKINRLKQLATVYDFESAQEIITQLIGDITDE